MHKAFAEPFRKILSTCGTSCLVVGLGLVLAVWWGAFALIGIERKANQQEIESETTNLSRVFRQNVVRSLKLIDATLIYLRQAHARWPGIDWHSMLPETLSSGDAASSLTIIDASGKLVASEPSPLPPTPIDLPFRDYFRVHANFPADTFYLSKPIIDPATKRWSIQATRRLVNADGTFGGVVVASLDPEIFSSLYRSLDLGRGGQVTLVGLDGIVRASGGTQSARLGEPLDDTSVMDAIYQRRSTTVHYRDALTGNDRIASTRWVDDYDLAVIVATDEHQPVGSWKRATSTYLAGASVLSLLILSAVAIILRRNTRLAETRQQLDRKRRQHELTLETMSQGIMLVDAQGEIGFMNGRLVELLGLENDFPRKRLSYQKYIEILDQRGEFIRDTDPNLQAFIRTPELRDTIPIYERERPNGTFLEIRTNKLPDGGFVRTVTDITARRRAEAKVLQLARHDALTGLTNRAVFRQQLEEALAELPTGRPLAILMIDLDRFKLVNDTYGHAIGDQLLRQVADRLRTVVRCGDLISRLGGDEFAVIHIGVNQVELAETVAHRVWRKLSEPYTIDGHSISIGASIGIALSPLHGTNAQDLLNAADLALYTVKGHGRGHSAVFDQQMHNEQGARRKLESELRHAIDNKEFELHYQPILSIDGKHVTAYEALIRWRHPQLGLVPPMEFIPLAEETGLIGPIGAWVLDTACHDIVQREGDARVAVNLSAVQFRDPNLVEVVIKALDRSGLPAWRLELEITESALLQDGPLTERHLSELRLLGVHITMDDFGTGYSSLSYLLSYPIQSLKIDRSFVKDLGGARNPAAIVKTITMLAASLGLSTTAEGVETEAQLQVLRELGCTEAQGYYFSRPKPAAEILPPRSKDQRVLRIAG